MSRRIAKGGESSGRLTSGLRPDTLTDQILRFVQTELPGWRDDPDRPDQETTPSEERLNGQLCDYLTVAARDRLPMVFFHHEERQTGTRRVDFGAHPCQKQFVGERCCTIYEPIIVFEGKRLPSPGNDRRRTREYVTGEGGEKSGGIQRFKLGLHGDKHKLAAMIGYIEKGEPIEWLKRINGWIRELEESFRFDGETWSAKEQLTNFVEDTSNRTASASSIHSRVGKAASKSIHIRHLWVTMYDSRRGPRRQSRKAGH
jgi:hypothetical protein